jgi:lipopolysaccharide transport system permease protein
MLRALWRYRSFVLGMVGREFRSRYVGSLLGLSWSVLTPLATILIYLVVFSQVMRGRLPGRGDALSYGVFLCTGILVWGLFAEVVVRSQGVFLEYANLLKKLAFPRITLPVVVLLASLLHFAIVGALFLALLALVGRLPGPALVAFVPLLALQQALAVGLGILLGTLNVFFRDIGQLVGVGLNLWFWGTPIVYHLDLLGERARALVAANPLTPLFLAYQGIVLEGSWPRWATLAPTLVAAALALALGVFAFRRLSGDMVDEL